MSITERIQLCTLIEKMNDNQEYSKRLGVSNISKYKGTEIQKRTKEISYTKEERV